MPKDMRDPAEWSKMREAKTYRGWLRNNAITWQGVDPDMRVEYPPLIRKVSQRGEVHY
jgi:hypothetical protein